MAHIVGGGTSDTDRKNIHTLDWAGNAWFAGEVRVGGSSYKTAATAATMPYVDGITRPLARDVRLLKSVTEGSFYTV